jgi:hypothetical protein
LCHRFGSIFAPIDVKNKFLLLESMAWVEGALFHLLLSFHNEKLI